jgi:hypothetical protein
MARETRLRRALALLALVVATFGAALATSTLAGGAAVRVGEWIHSDAPRDAPAASDPSAAAPSARPWSVVAGLLDEWLGIMGDVVRELTRGELRGNIALAFAAAVSVAPALIAAPALRRTPPEHPGRSLRWSIAGAAFLGGTCALGILATLWDLVGLASVAAPEEPPSMLRGGNVIFPQVLVPAWAISGLLWAWAFARAGKAHAPDRLDRLVRWLVAGSCVELAIAAPTYAAAARRDTCYCAFGSWMAIVSGVTVLTVLCGPALLLLSTRRTRAEWMRAVCHECGYRRHGTQERCPECGSAFECASPAVGAPVQ